MCVICVDSQRSLAPLFSKVSPSEGQEATVPQTEKSPLTCIRSKLPCDREVPETDNTVRLPLSSGHALYGDSQWNLKTGHTTKESSRPRVTQKKYPNHRKYFSIDNTHFSFTELSWNVGRSARECGSGRCAKT